MPFLRKAIFQLHLWIGLAAGIFFILLGLSGSALVYPGLFQSSAQIPKAAAQGESRPLEEIIAAARDSAPQNQGRTAAVTLPSAQGDAMAVQFIAQQRGEGQAVRPGPRGARGRGNFGARGAPGPEGARGGNQQIFVDPVSGKILGSRVMAPSPLLGIARQMHEAMLMGGAGRSLVAWLGVGMFFLGLSGLYLWWPRKGQWKFAFGVRRNARGFRLYREIHGMMGIWFWLVFLVVTATSIPLGFPAVMAAISGNAGRREGPPPGFAQAQAIAVPEAAQPLALASLIDSAEKFAGEKAVSVTVPGESDRPVMVRVAGDPTSQVAINPYTGAVLPSPARQEQAGLNRGFIEQLHGGQRLGPVWKFLVFLSGFLPLVFVVTGLMMWLKKRQNKSAARTI